MSEGANQGAEEKLNSKPEIQSEVTKLPRTEHTDTFKNIFLSCLLHRHELGAMDMTQ